MQNRAVLVMAADAASGRLGFTYRGYEGFETSQGVGGLYIPKGHGLYGKKLNDIKVLSNAQDVLNYSHQALTKESREEVYVFLFAASRKRIECVVDQIIESIEKAAAE